MYITQKNKKFNGSELEQIISSLAEELATKRDILDIKILIESLENVVLRLQEDRAERDRERRF